VAITGVVFSIEALHQRKIILGGPHDRAHIDRIGGVRQAQSAAARRRLATQTPVNAGGNDPLVLASEAKTRCQMPQSVRDF
jgi:hypothetical protein